MNKTLQFFIQARNGSRMGDFLNTDNPYLTAGSLKRSESQGNPVENANILVPGKS